MQKSYLNKYFFSSYIFLGFLLLHSQIKAQPNAQIKPEIQHAKPYKIVDDINQYWISEKLDGIRGYWDGTQLLTRQGNTIHSPTWFTQDWPHNVMDGELWIARNQFQATLSCVKKLTIDEQCWRNVRFMIFDLPKHKGTFTQRITTMKRLIEQTDSTFLTMIRQFKLQSTQQLETTLNEVIAQQGEGLMLHLGSAFYHVGRTANIMKLKKYQDAEAAVIGYTNGKGKYLGMLGALTVKTPNGTIFNIGSGFTDEERVNPPPIGSIITYKFNGKTQAGIPRFARFYRIRNRKITK
ncbi:DNA ligase [Colwellia sp. MSW7]|uniref:DNA ligase n=1 Tax=Colwellia maritima TaxID=2912588 RepID=A0ABS9X4F7_9GAMM|nr:DNA ligase [Colwellia maritima]MCI2284955.1 DNA ligase [Colwellia maritima]